MNRSIREIPERTPDDKCRLIKIVAGYLMGNIHNHSFGHLPENGTFYRTDIMILCSPVAG